MASIPVPVVRQFTASSVEGAHLQFSPDGAYFVTICRTLYSPGPVTVWNRETWESVTTVFACSCAFSPDSRVLYLLQKESVECYDLVAGTITASFPLPHGRGVHIAVSPSGHRIAAALSSMSDLFTNEVIVFDANNPDQAAELCSIPTDPGWPVFVEFLAEDCLGVVVSVRTAVSSEIHLFALPTGEPLRRLPTPSIPLGGDPLAFGTSQSFSSTSDGTFTAAVTEGSRVLRMWKTEDGSVLRDLRFAPYDPTVGLDRYRNASIPQPRVLQGDFSPGGDRLATLERTAWNGEALLKIWDVLTGEIEQEILWTASSGSNSLAWDPRGELLAVTGSRDDQDGVLFLRFSDGQVVDLLGQADPVDVTSVVLLDNETILWAGPDSIIRQGSIATGESEIWAAVEPVLWQSPPIEDDDDDAEDYVITDDLTQISKLSLHPGGRLLASAHGSGIVRVWDIERRAVVHELPAMLWDWDSYDPDYGEPGLDCDFSSDGRYLITGGSDCGLRLWETETGEEVQMLPLDSQGELDRWNPIAQVAALPSSDGSGTCAVISDVSRTILQVWDLSEGKKTAEVPGSQGGYVRDAMMDSPQFCILPGGHFAVQSNGRGRIWTYALPQWERLREVIVWDDGAVGPFAASPIAPLIAVGSFGDGISLRILPSGREAALLPFAAGEVLCLRFSPDGRYLAAGGRFGMVSVYDLSGIVTAQKAGG